MRPFPCLDRVDVDPILLPGFAPAALLPETEHPATPASPALHWLRRERAAVLIADVAGYSRLIERDDVNTVVRLRQLRCHVIEPAMVQWGARIVRLAGDGVFSVFAEAAEALDSAIAVQRGLVALERDVPPEWRLRLRIGISFGEALVEKSGDLHGRAVNIAARLEALAEPGGIYLTGETFDEIAGRSGPRCEALGLRRLRHIMEPVRVYRVVRSELLARWPAWSTHERLLSAE